VLFSGGEKQDSDAAVLYKVKLYMDCGATGVMFGRNMWLRQREHALALTRQVHPHPGTLRNEATEARSR
jgi:class I fructose-bisphosphate aldolase